VRFDYDIIKRLVEAADEAEDWLGVGEGRHDEEAFEVRERLSKALKAWHHLQRNPSLEFLKPFWYSTGPKNRAHLMCDHVYLQRERPAFSGMAVILREGPCARALCGEDPYRSVSEKFSPAPEAERCSRCMDLAVKHTMEDDLLSGFPNLAPARIGDVVDYSSRARCAWVLRDPDTLILAMALTARQPDGKALIIKLGTDSTPPYEITRSLKYLEKV
jgi:hypothetical protein